MRHGLGSVGRPVGEVALLRGGMEGLWFGNGGYGFLFCFCLIPEKEKNST